MNLLATLLSLIAQRVSKKHAVAIIHGDRMYPPFLKDFGSRRTLIAQYAFKSAK